MAQTTDTKFFTNESGFTLYDRFNHTLKSARFFDTLAGYFRTSGFYRLYKSLDNVEKIRILVGLNVDSKVVDILENVGQQHLNFESQTNIRKQFQDEIEKEFAASDDTAQVDEGVLKFKEMLLAGKIEIKACRDKNIHAKVYITRYHEGALIDGSVITGSSNFTENGLNVQYEFNVELKDPPDVKFALEKFEELWADAVPVSDDYIDAIENRTWLNDTITPYEMYLKFLYEYFCERINVENIKPDLPDGYMDLRYQTDAIAQIYKIVEDYDGIFISDVVGLGKTYIATMYAKILKGKVLVIAPPPIMQNWENAFKDFNILPKNYDIVSIGKLQNVIEKLEQAETSGEKTYEYVFVDEAHRFRNGKNQQYEQLKRICQNKKVILISATPLNNTFFDFYYLISLFQNPINSDIPGIQNLEAFFSNRKQKIKKIDQEFGKDSEEYINAVKQVSKEVRDKILSRIMIRRTRTDIKKHFSDDMEKQGLFFPEVQKPERLVYEFDTYTNSVFEKTIKVIGGKNVPTEEKLSYARYAPKMYLKKQLTSYEAQQQKNNVGFMKSRLVKRLESSKYAFEKTLERSIESHKKLLKMYNDGTVYISKDINVLDYIDDDTKTIEDLLEKGREKELEIYASSDFKPEFIEYIKHDIQLLQETLDSWKEIKHDYKQEKFIKELKENNLLKDKKLVIFTESSETGEQLSNVLKENFGNNVLFYSSNKSECLKEIIKDNYDPNKKECFQKDNIQLLVTTDVLSEGINLHRSNIIVNYDLPWNPTKVLQRVGRVNRVGTQHDKIFIFNFFPTSQTDKELGLESSIIAKIQAFHNALGEDAKYLSDEEEVESYNMRGEEQYRILNSINEFNEQEDENIELKYLTFLRKLRDKDTDTFEKIKNLPKKIRVARESEKTSIDSLITFFRKGRLNKFCITDGSKVSEIPFDEAVKYFECDKNAKRKSLPEQYFDYLAKNKDLFGQPIETEELSSKAGKSKYEKIIRDLKAVLRTCRKYTEDEKGYIQSVITAFCNRT
ncbi:MAG: SNF2-related protein, partial [Candidatus Gastranaerophilales bacterium]|nr:SNF2-related protein [Candidatus Gastranaerophilales bacterium]